MFENFGNLVLVLNILVGFYSYLFFFLTLELKIFCNEQHSNHDSLHSCLIQLFPDG